MGVGVVPQSWFACCSGTAQEQVQKIDVAGRGWLPTLPAMIVCVCNGLSERDVRTVVERDPGVGVGDVYRRLGCRVSCGKCVPYVAELVQVAWTTPLIGPGDRRPEPVADSPRLPAEAA